MSEKTVAGIPQMGFGTWKRNGEEAYNTVQWALEAGYRHIDTAQGYGNEAEVGSAVRDSSVPREDVFVTTKVAPDNFGPGEVRSSTEESLAKLQMDAVDLLLLHWPSPRDEYPLETYVSQLGQIHDDGLAKNIGVSNFTIAHVEAAREILGDRPIATNQCEIHVYMQNRPIVEYCQKIGMPMTAYSPLARGAIVGDSLLDEIGAKHGVTGDLIALAFLMAEGHIVIPTSSRKERILSNRKALEVSLDEQDVGRLRELDQGKRLIDPDDAPRWD